MPTPFLNLPIVSPTQDNKIISINDAAQGIERAMQGKTSIDFSGGAVELDIYTFTRFGVFVFEGATGGASLTIPSNVDGSPTHRQFIVSNATSYAITVMTGLGAVVEAAPGVNSILSTDGTDVRLVVAGAPAPTYPVAIFSPGDILPDLPVVVYAVTADITFPIDFTGSFASVRNAPSGGSVVFDITKNGGSVGSLTFADGSEVGVFTMATEVTFNAGDALVVDAPSDVFDIAYLTLTLFGA